MNGTATRSGEQIKGVLPSLSGILAAYDMLTPYAGDTPLTRSESLSQEFAADVWIKNETASPIRCFKHLSSMMARAWESLRSHLDTATSELLQHEIDHLDGVLAIDRALDRDSIILRETYSMMQEHFRKLVDYEIGG